MTAAGDEAAAPRPTWVAVLGLVVLFGAWAAFAWQGALVTQGLWSSLPNDLGASVATALTTSIAWIALLGTLLLLVGATRSSSLRILDGAIGVAAGAVGIAAAVAVAGAPVMPSQHGVVAWAAAGGAITGGALLLAAPLVQRHRRVHPSRLRHS
ncbi:hypothetical protein D8Y24_04890 [Agrococcus lahaulensis]|nr:hypothetical protein D8Y24_04890 [Agrococcus lahaulensis]